MKQQTKQIPDFWLVIISAAATSCAFMAWQWFPTATTGMRLLLFPSIFICPALVLYGFWAVLRKHINRNIVLCSLIALPGVYAWTAYLLETLNRLNGRS